MASDLRMLPVNSAERLEKCRARAPILPVTYVTSLSLTEGVALPGP
jgi:hypothetical protein